MPMSWHRLAELFQFGGLVQAIGFLLQTLVE